MSLGELVASLQGDFSSLGKFIRSIDPPTVCGAGNVTIRGHYLPFRGGKPRVGELLDHIRTYICNFALSRSEIQAVHSNMSSATEQERLLAYVKLRDDASDLFIKAQKTTNRNGECGELLLYLFTEWILEAPQILAKMPLKTNSSMPVHGSDGIHLKYDAGTDRLIFFWGEAKFHSRGEPSAALRELSELAKEAVRPKYALTVTAQNGVGFHYGNIPTVLRNAVEQAFISGDLQYLVCTSTLLAGVNLPAQNIFMCSPHRKKGVALDSIDFWNLSGRAGRLRREFQGNIYLINYEKWEAQPLAGPRLNEIVPAIRNTIETKAEQLEAVIVGEPIGERHESSAGLDTAFVRLLSDFKRGRVEATLDHANISTDLPIRKRLEDALTLADTEITLTAEVLSSSPTISPHRQQELYREFERAIAEGGEHAARGFLLAHPRESTAFDSYVSALSLCHRTILPKSGSDRQNRFFATMLLKWMQGISIPELVEDRIRFNKASSTATNIRATLDLVETELRFNYVRTFACYLAVLGESLRMAGFVDLLKSLPSIPLYLEVGASDKTMISFISLGLSRMAAKRLSNICPIKSYNVADARIWLLRQDLETLGFTAHIKREVDRALNGQFSVS